MKKAEKKELFLKMLKDIYNDKSLHLKEKTKEEILKQYSDVSNNKTNINYASYYLFPFVSDEYYNTKSEKLNELKKMILKYRYKCYFGMLLDSALIGFR